MQNYQNGGWYNNPQTGRNQQYWNGQWYDTPQQGNQQSSSNNSAQSYIDTLNKNDNAYIDQLIQEKQGQLDLILKQIDAQHKLALGNDDQATAQFLEKVASDLESKVGRIPYDYQKYTNRELQDYAMGSQNIADNKQLLTDKLNNDQRLAEQQLKFQQGNDNQSLVEKLASRGLLGTGKPTGMYQGTDLTGLDGIAGQQAGLQNTDYHNKYDQLYSTNALNQQGINLDAQQQQNTLNFNHQNTLTDLADTARRGVQDQQLNDQNAKAQAQNTFDVQKADLERRRQQYILGNTARGSQLAGSANNVLGF